MTKLISRQALLASAAVPLAVLAFAGPAHAQSGAPASGTTIAPPAAGPSSGAATPERQDDGVPPPDSGQLEDIVVTARRTNEALQTTPVAVTALTATALLEKQVAEVTDLARTTPSLSIGTGGTGPATIVYLAIRGQAQNSPNSFSDAAVGIYIDGVYVGRPIVGNLGFLDMASAEILRGPQGTLFGRNTTGGALNLTTAAPTQDFEGYVKGGIGNYDQRLIEGVINVPATDELAFRVAARYDERDGYFPNPFLGKRQGSVNESYYVRGSAKWEPEALPIVLNVSGDYQKYADNGNPTAVAAINPASPLAAFYGISQGVQAGAIPAGAPIPLAPGVSVPAGAFANFSVGSGPLSQYINPEFAGSTNSNNWRTSFGFPRTGNPEIDNLANLNEAYSFTANLSIDLGDATIKSITGYRDSDTSSRLDLTGTPTGGGAFVTQYRQHQFSQELQLQGEIGRLQYIGGLYYFREAGDERSDSAIFYNTPIGVFNRSLGDFISKSYGIFAQVNYNFTDALRVTGGLRYTWDKRFIDRHAVVDWRAADPVCSVGVNAGRPASQAECTDPNSDKFDYPAWTAGVDYKLNPDVFVYAKTSGASLSGGFNSRPVPAPFSQSFQPEDVRDIELGVKGEFLNRRLRLNLAGFYAWQNGVQRIVNTTFVDPTTNQTRLTQFVTNAGDARDYGVELEGTVIPVRGLTIDGSVAYLKAKYKSGTRDETQLVGGVPVIVDRSDEPVTQAPKWTASIGATQAIEFDAGELRLHADYSYVSSRYFDFFTTGDPAQAAAVAIGNEASRITGYGLLNGTVTFTLREPEIEFTLYGKNLTGTKWFTNVFNSYTGLGATLQFQGAPRTYGVTAAFRF